MLHNSATYIVFYYSRMNIKCIQTPKKDGIYFEGTCTATYCNYSMIHSNEIEVLERRDWKVEIC